MKNKIFILVAIVIAIGAFFVLKSVNKPELTPPPAAPVAWQDTFFKSHNVSYGNTLSRVMVVEWFDPECEACRMVHPMVKQIIKDYKDRVHFVLRYMPYHQGSMYAASALEEAREHGKFDEALDLLFEKQPEWGDHHQPRPELISTYLATLGIPKDKLDRDTVIKKHGDKVRMDEADGKTVGVQGTPSFFINGQQLQELGERPLREAIDAALNSAK